MIIMPSMKASSRQLAYELTSGISGLFLALFMWGHMVLVGSILTGERGFNWMASMLEEYYIAQPTVLAILLLFLVHAVLAARKIPAQLQQRRQLGSDLKKSSGFDPHVESLLWIWQVRTGMAVLVLGSFHVILLSIDVLTPLFGERVGIEALTSLARVQAGLWIPYAILLVCVEFHASVGLYRLAVKWGVFASLSRPVLRAVEHVLLWFFLGLGVAVLLVLAGIIAPPFAFLLAGSAV
jgi:fumarate reductase subunit C